MCYFFPASLLLVGILLYYFISEMILFYSAVYTNSLKEKLRILPNSYQSCLKTVFIYLLFNVFL